MVMDMILPGEEKGAMDSFKNSMLVVNNHIRNHKAERAMNFWTVPPDFPHLSA